MRGHPLIGNPDVDRLLGDAQVSGDVVGRQPGLTHEGTGLTSSIGVITQSLSANPLFWPFSPGLLSFGSVRRHWLQRRPVTVWGATSVPLMGWSNNLRCARCCCNTGLRGCEALTLRLYSDFSRPVILEQLTVQHSTPTFFSRRCTTPLMLPRLWQIEVHRAVNRYLPDAWSRGRERGAP